MWSPDRRSQLDVVDCYSLQVLFRDGLPLINRFLSPSTSSLSSASSLICLACFNSKCAQKHLPHRSYVWPALGHGLIALVGNSCATVWRKSYIFFYSNITHFTFIVIVLE